MFVFTLEFSKHFTFHVCVYPECNRNLERTPACNSYLGFSRDQNQAFTSPLPAQGLRKFLLFLKI